MERMNMSTSPSSSCLPQLGPVTLAPPSHLASVPAGGSELLPHLLPSSANSSPYMSPWDPACVLPLSHEYASHGEASEIAPAASAGPIDTGVAEDARERQNGITDASVAPSLLQRAHPLSLFAPLSRNIQVVCRLRPMTKEKGACVDPKHSERALTVPSSASGRASTNTIHARYPSSLSSTSVNSTGTGNRLAQDFVFDHVFGEDSSQASVFEKIGSQLVHAVCSGFNATILAYGQSSSGKTYTIIGDHASEEGFSDGGAAHGEGIHSIDAQQTCETSERRRRGVPGSDHGDSLGVVKGTPSLSHDGMADGSIGNERTQTRKREDGKTSGSPNVGDGDGLLPRMIQALFTWMKHHEDPRVRRRVLVAAIEIYNENVRDLIGGKCGLKIQRRKHRRKGEGCVSIVGLQEESPQSPVEAFAILDKTIKARRAGSTRMNAESSRSHFIFSLTLEETLLETGDLKVGRLTVVDLAGSERVAKTGSVGATLQEGSMINKSLTCLGKVISTLGAISERAHDTGSSGPSAALSTEGSFTGSSSAIPSAPSSSPPVSQAQQSTAASLPISSFVPYRDSKLTRVLQDALGGNSNTCLILTCSPDAVHMSESLSTLRFGQRAMCVRNTPKVNVERAHDENDVPAIKKHQQIILEYEKFTAHLMTWAHEILLNLVQSQISQGAPYPAYTAVHDGHAPPGLSLSPLSSPLHASSSRDFKESPQQAQGLCRLPSSRNKTQGHTIAASGAEHLKDNGRSSFEKTATDARSSRESLFSALESILSAMPSAPESLMLARPQKADFLSKIKQNVIDLLTMREHDEDEMHDRTGGRHPKNTAMELQKVEGEPKLALRVQRTEMSRVSPQPRKKTTTTEKKALASGLANGVNEKHKACPWTMPTLHAHLLHVHGTHAEVVTATKYHCLQQVLKMIPHICCHEFRANSKPIDAYAGLFGVHTTQTGLHLPLL
ncbi:putative kinesin [Besnoitia besnoiti]|uniref:Kinesin-like protein n=1 Tax=Besnoitia besnoiti TaxID=94643 RepID=A0A2A9MKQ0_BESBE|nr:putative kinesin [Besnoitia besnoiti]PFH36002.1 putative kinesin [Besnoitia besnoiti]